MLDQVVQPVLSVTDNSPEFQIAVTPSFFASGGVNAQVDVASTHFCSTCNQSDTDMKLFSTIPGFVSDVEYFRQQFALRTDLHNVAVWVTENNVNADFADSPGNSSCNPGQKFIPDHRGTSAFFAAWRPYVFSQLAKAGSQELNHWDYDADNTVRWTSPLEANISRIGQITPSDSFSR